MKETIMNAFTPRTAEEIIARIHELEKEGDFFGHQRGDLLDFLTFDDAKQFLRSEKHEELRAQWASSEPLEEVVKKKMQEYMSFAWEKANNERGLSAGRSIEHMQAWLWLLRDPMSEEIPNMEFAPYGKPILRAICNKFGWDCSQWDKA